MLLLTFVCSEFLFTKLLPKANTQDYKMNGGFSTKNTQKQAEK